MCSYRAPHSGNQKKNSKMQPAATHERPVGCNPFGVIIAEIEFENVYPFRNNSKSEQFNIIILIKTSNNVMIYTLGGFRNFTTIDQNNLFRSSFGSV